MSNKFYIKSRIANQLLDVFKLTSEKYLFLLAVTESTSLKNGDIIYISKSKLKMCIKTLLSNRRNKYQIDFGNRFEKEQTHEMLFFDNIEYLFETSGYDNLLIFAIKLFDNQEDNFVLTNEL